MPARTASENAAIKKNFIGYLENLNPVRTIIKKMLDMNPKNRPLIREVDTSLREVIHD